MSSTDFDKIFGPGEFDDEENTYQREFSAVEAGGSRNVLDFSTLWEHANRHGYDVMPHPNGTSKDLEINRDNMDIYVENFPDGRTALKIDFDESIRDVEAYMRGTGNNHSVDQWLGEIIRREQKAYRAATNFVHNVVPKKAEEKGLTETELLSEELDFPKGGSFSRFHEEYRSRGPSDVGMNYGSEFEIWPWETEEEHLSDLPGKMPMSDEIQNPDKRPRNDLYQRMYLTALVEEMGEKYGVKEDVSQKWLDYVDLGFS